MIKKRVLEPTRVRHVNGSFSFIPHRFLSDGFWASLNHHELVLYLFLVLASDKRGLSYYSSKRICSLLGISHDEYITTRDRLIARDLIAFNGTIFQVLELPARPITELPKTARSLAELINQVVKEV
ncbi:MAG TPA: hypothetical protein VMW44_01315 [Candidatus Bathyarchaeia archaeon]|jgi:hypothetical protein|nr:hypothetical protein [Candidatus Bathyarchaeia archaeon]